MDVFDIKLKKKILYNMLIILVNLETFNTLIFIYYTFNVLLLLFPNFT